MTYLDIERIRLDTARWEEFIELKAIILNLASPDPWNVPDPMTVPLMKRIDLLFNRSK